MNIQKYLERIGLAGMEPDGSAEQLNRLIAAHTESIAFENLDAWLYKKVPDLDTEALYRKIVENSRGGWCHELNGLFCEFLKALGYKAFSTGARLFINGQVSGMGHRCTICEIEGMRYYVDVGYGSLFLMSAVPFDGSVTPYGFHVENEGKWYFVYKGDSKVIGFSDVPFEPQDFVIPNYYDATFPGLFFNQTLYSSKLENGVRVEFKGDTLSVGSGAEKKVIFETSDVEEKKRILWERFGLKIPE